MMKRARPQITRAKRTEARLERVLQHSKTNPKGPSMELRTLRYFLALVNEGTVSKAAKSLNVTQPTLSRQLSDLEKEFGKQLFNRGSKRIQLTEDGIILREYAQSILSLADRATTELSQPGHAIVGSVRIACGEAVATRPVFRSIKRMQIAHPAVQFHIFSGNSSDLIDRFNSGLFDFFQESELASRVDCHVLPLPDADHWGVVMRRDAPLATLEKITPQDLINQPIIGSRQGMKVAGISDWAGELFNQYHVVTTYNLAYNGGAMAKEGIGYCVCYDELVDVSEESGMCFRPLDPPVISYSGILWKKHRMLSKAAETFLGYLRSEVEDATCSNSANSKKDGS